jgi:hypothetical protein
MGPSLDEISELLASGSSRVAHAETDDADDIEPGVVKTAARILTGLGFVPLDRFTDDIRA